MNDILVQNIVEHDQNLVCVNERCREKGLKLNKEKVVLRVPEVKYVGHIIGKDGL